MERAPARVTQAARPRPPGLAAYLLHRYDWSETSLVLDLFTREQGRIVVAAKGAKRPYSQLRSVLLPFQRIHIALGRAPRGDDAEIRNLRSAEWAGGAMLSGAALFDGFYLNELVMKLLARQDPHVELFDAYAATLPALSAADARSAERALRAFELALLRGLGVLPDLTMTTSTLAPVQAARDYTLRCDSGVDEARGASADAIPGGALIGLQAALDHGSVPALQHACGPVLPALKVALAGLLQPQLGAALRSPAVLLGVQRLA